MISADEERAVGWAVVSKALSKMERARWVLLETLDCKFVGRLILARSWIRMWCMYFSL